MSNDTRGKPGTNYGPAGTLFLMLLLGAATVDSLEHVLLQAWQWWIEKRPSATA